MGVPGNPNADGGSYRDPSGFVFYLSGGVYRTVADSTWGVMEEVFREGIVDDLVSRGWLVGSRIVEDGSEEHRTLCAAMPGWRHFIAHEKVPVISYPYEWTLSMLADAALLHLQIQKRLLKKGFALKDATAFNVQFIGPKPVFIDIGSIEKPQRMDIWVAYSQFCRMFLYPLLLFSRKRLSFRSIFMASVDGIEVDQAYALLGRWQSLAPSLFLDVYLQYVLNKKGHARARELRAEMTKPRRDPGPQILNLDRLARKVRGIREKQKVSGLWSEYEVTNTYTDSSRTDKEAFISKFMQEFKPATVLDLGCNTGEYSRIAAQAGAAVIALDGDHDSVELLYRKAFQEKMGILPLVADLTNPSPGLGFRNRERAALLERIRCEAVFALALVHHLLIAGRIPLAAIRDLMAELTSRYLVIEYVDREDPMFQTLLALREDLYKDLTPELFTGVFKERFELFHEAPLPGLKRRLMTFRLRNA